MTKNEALSNWKRATTKERAVPEAFYDAMMAANATEVFADQRSLYGFAERGMGMAIGLLTGLRGRDLQMLIDHIHSTGEYDVPSAINSLGR